MVNSLDPARLKEQNPIEEVAGQYGIIFDEKGGGHCPFPDRHNNGDANPSLHLDRNHQRLRCQSQDCFGGPVDVIGLVMKMDGIGFKAACQKLAQRAGLSNGHTHLPTQGSSRIVATYDYRDESGNLLYQIVRKEPGPGGKSKDFVIRRPDGNGGWTWKQGDVRLVPYRLPDLLKTAGQVVVVEGEKCADTLWDLDVAATCNPFGAGKWREEFNAYLQGREVVLWPDKDERGRRHAEAVGCALQGMAASIRWLEPPVGLPDKGDVADGVQRLGWTCEEVGRLLEGAQPWEPAGESPLAEGPRNPEEDNQAPPEYPTARRLAEVEPEEVCWLWWPRIPLRHLTTLEGDPGEGKSFVAQALATAVSLGRGLPGMDPTEPANVLLLAAEDHAGCTIRPRLEAMGADLNRVFCCTDGFTLDAEGLEATERLLGETRPRLVVLDPLTAYLPSNLDLHRANEVRAP